MLQSMGSQKVGHNLATEQEPTLTLLTNHVVHVHLQGLAVSEPQSRSREK